MTKPILLYDGDCGFCQYCVDYLAQITGHQVHYQPYQQGTLGRPPAAAEKAIQLVVSETEFYQGAAAGFKVLSFGGRPLGWWSYQNVPGFKWLSEKTYHWITRHRNLCFAVAKVVCGNPWQVGRLTIVFWGFLFLVLVLTFSLSS